MSSYSPYFKFDLPATGQAGWGTNINNNFQYLVEQALGGFQTADMTSNVDYSTILNGVSSAGRCMSFLLTGTPASSTTLTLPAAMKISLIYNSTAQTIVINTPSSGSGGSVSVASNQTAIVACTGTNLVKMGCDVNDYSNLRMKSLGVNTDASGVGGEIRATGNITAYYSDDRLKTRKGNIENALEKVLSLDGFHYEANETAQALGYEAKPEVGLSAQQVQAVLPEVVVPAPIDNKYLTVHYERIIPLLVEAIKEQNKKIEALEAKLNGAE